MRDLLTRRHKRSRKSVKATFYKNGLIINLVILFVFFCAFESIDLPFSTDRFFVSICMFFYQYPQ